LIETSAQTLESLLSDVLDLAQIESGRMTLKLEPFELDQAVAPVAALFEPAATAKGLAFELSLPPESRGALNGDVFRIRQILSNLISNAVKFTTRGEVRVAVTAAPTGSGATRCAFSVTDSGIGFDDAAKARLFERFEQADGSITRRFGGTGLGLAISRSLAEQMGGSLTAEAVPGQGATFTFAVELEPAAGEAARAEPMATPECGRGAGMGAAPRVLLAEDHPTNRRVVELILGAVGVDLTSVENGQEAVDAFAAQPFDLILMDMQMPVMDGLTATRELRRIASLRDLPIVAMTANAMEQDRRRCIDAGMNDFLAKPIDPQDMVATMVRWIRGSPRAGTGAVPAPAPTMAAATPPASSVDLPRVAGLDTKLGLSRMMGKKPLYLRMLRRYVESQKDTGVQIRSALAANDRSTAERLAHTLKGVSGNIGASDLQSLADALEDAMRQGQYGGEVMLRLAQLEAPLAQLVSDLEFQLPASSEVAAS
jgi:two-component system, sensor histidine kinase and response regulator